MSRRALTTLFLGAAACQPTPGTDDRIRDGSPIEPPSLGPTDTGDALEIPSVAGACREPVEVQVTSVTDGDTFEVQGPDGEETVRIIGVDTPESWGTPDCYGDEVSDYTKERLDGRTVWLSFDRDCDDSYDRTLAYVYLEDGGGGLEWYEQTLLTLGYARTMSISPNDSHEEHFADLLLEAQEAGVGMWSACPTAPGVQLGHVQGEVIIPKLVVTSQPVTEGYGFYVQDPGGGPWSGLFVYTDQEVADVQVGDQLTVSGEAAEYYGATQLVAESWYRTDDDWVERSWLDGAQEDWQPWDGVLLKAYDVEILAETEDGYETDLGLLIDDAFFAPALEVGDVTDLAGIVRYAWSSWRLAPRDEDDLD